MSRTSQATRPLIKRPSQPISTLYVGLLGSVLCWLALPPANWHWLAWVAPAPWLILIRTETLPGTRPYRKLWLAGMVFWLLAVHWIRLPHPLNYLAWFSLTAYLGLYLPLFVLLSRTGVHRWRIPLVIVAPVVWTGLDWVRAHFLTGFLMASLAHTQYRVPVMIQLADIAGEYGVTFLIMFVAANILEILFFISKGHSSRTLLRRAPACFVRIALPLVIAVYYGVVVEARHRIQESEAQTEEATRIALIQGNTPADWKMDQKRQEDIMREYMQLSRDAVRQARANDGKPVDVVVWPETAFRQTLISARVGYTPPPERVPDSTLTVAKADLAELVRQLGCAALVGIDRVEIVPSDAAEIKYEAFNSAVLVHESGNIIATYDKMHRVPFGEFIPLAHWFPFLYDLTPLTGGIFAGASSTVMELDDGALLSPNICYETVVPHLIRRQWNDYLAKAGRPPEVLVNITNDAWFWGSSELDMHLACGVFRAVETRTPLLIAANGGLSAYVDQTGHIRQVTPRQQTAILLVDLDRRRSGGSFYVMYGDWFAGLCVVCCVILAFAAARAGMWHSSNTPR
jgi:apolipoprotein N-acyltransferase